MCASRHWGRSRGTRLWGFPGLPRPFLSSAPADPPKTEAGPPLPPALLPPLPSVRPLPSPITEWPRSICWPSLLFRAGPLCPAPEPATILPGEPQRTFRRCHTAYVCRQYDFIYFAGESMRAGSTVGAMATPGVTVTSPAPGAGLGWQVIVFTNKTEQNKTQTKNCSPWTTVICWKGWIFH